MNTLLKAAVLGMSVLAMQSVSEAALLGIPPQSPPDVSSFGVTVSYDVGTGWFTATGGAIILEKADTSTANITPILGSFQIAVQLDSSGAPIDNTGTLTISSTIPSEGYNSGTLLFGNMTPGGFGFETGGGSQFEFLFNVTSGDLTAIWGPQAAVRLNAAFPTSDVGTPGNFTGSFLTSFDNLQSSGFPNNDANSDTYSVPEPASIALMGLAGLCIIRRKRR